MAIHNIWLGPVFIAAYSLFALLICISISAYYHYLPPRWPYLSEIATQPPASNVYSLMTNHIAVMVVFWIYIKHREIVSYFSNEDQGGFKRAISFGTMCVGLVGALALEMSVNFPKEKVPFIQTSASLCVLVCTVVYIWMHSFISFLIKDDNIKRIPLFVVRLSLAAALTSCTISMLEVFEKKGDNFVRTTAKPMDLSSTGAVLEWAVYFSMALFLLTDAYEFRNLIVKPLKLVIPGSPLYNTPDNLPALRTRELSFADLPSSSMTEPLVR
ncbi:unnamed protein product [Auanema sp. JU1783]|nr:unnamed protein product [Auanema sp. JU1783]